ncbi:MAG: DUF1573 domain-containing protein [Saprospirales bacterium]|jgi:hypothetical protein|nr:DUF1573 domain-containing protein [Saprospirales bacterium]MBK8923159.1 DUF1573 domain-containing protein [Saprospirales bacterium]
MYWILLFLSWATPDSCSAERAGALVKWTTETDHDFGILREGSVARFTFQFENTSGGPVVLQTVRTTCGCTAAEWPEAPVGPGENGAIKIEFAADRGGAFRKKIAVFFDKQRKAEVLWIRGEVE